MVEFFNQVVTGSKLMAENFKRVTNNCKQIAESINRAAVKYRIWVVSQFLCKCLYLILMWLHLSGNAI